MTELELASLRARIATEALEYALHATRRMLQRNITEHELRAAIASRQVVEDYPVDFYGPSCFIFGCSAAGRPLQYAATPAGQQ